MHASEKEEVPNDQIRLPPQFCNRPLLRIITPSRFPASVTGGILGAPPPSGMGILIVAWYRLIPESHIKRGSAFQIGEFALDDRMGDESGFPASASQPQPKPPSLFCKAHGRTAVFPFPEKTSPKGGLPVLMRKLEDVVLIQVIEFIFFLEEFVLE